MVNTIYEKLNTSPSIRYYKTYAVADTPKPIPQEIPEESNNDNRKTKDYTLPLGLLASGGVLMYLGLKRPSLSKVFGEKVNQRLFDMEIALHKYTSFVKTTLDSSVVELSDYIKAYRKEQFVTPKDSLVHINMMTIPQKVVEAQDLAFEALFEGSKEMKLGASDMDSFLVKLDKVRSGVLSQVAQKKQQTELVLNDYVYLPAFSDHTHPDLVEEAENKLIGTKNCLLGQMDDIRDANVSTVLRNKLQEMVDNIVEVRASRYKTKKLLVNESFSQIRRMLNLPETFVPNYDKNIDLSGFEALTKEQLKPQEIPNHLQKYYGNNLCLSILAKQDFNELTEKDLEKYFYSLSYDSSIKDLKFFIDRLRLHQAVANVTPNSTEEKEALSVTIPKLEYFVDKLEKFGIKELLKHSSKDFEVMDYSKRRVALAKVNSVARRLGYDTIEQMDKEFSKTNSRYATLNMRNYMDIFRSQPNLYFF